MTNDLTGLPHLSTRDDVYRGYFIPKGQFDFQFAFCFFLGGEFAVDHLVQRIYNDSQCMVSRLVCL